MRFINYRIWFQYVLRFIFFTGFYAFINEALFVFLISINVANLKDIFNDINFLTWFFVFRLPVYAFNGLLDLALCKADWQRNAFFCRNQLILTLDVLIVSILVFLFSKIAIFIGLWTFFRYGNIAFLYSIILEADTNIIVPLILAFTTYVFVNLSYGLSRKFALWLLKEAHLVS